MTLLILLSCKRSEIIETNLKIDSEKVEEKLGKSTITNSSFTSENIFGSWSNNVNDTSSILVINEKSLRFIGQTNSKSRRYNISNNKIEIFLKNYTQTGIIKKAENDSLVIYWASGEYVIYLRL